MMPVTTGTYPGGQVPRCPVWCFREAVSSCSLAEVRQVLQVGRWAGRSNGKSHSKPSSNHSCLISCCLWWAQHVGFLLLHSGSGLVCRREEERAPLPRGFDPTSDVTHEATRYSFEHKSLSGARGNQDLASFGHSLCPRLPGPGASPALGGGARRRESKTTTLVRSLQDRSGKCLLKLPSRQSYQQGGWNDFGVIQGKNGFFPGLARSYSSLSLRCDATYLSVCLFLVFNHCPLRLTAAWPENGSLVLLHPLPVASAPSRSVWSRAASTALPWHPFGPPRVGD